MKCRYCGHEIPDGVLYCENCGKEVRIVPDYNPLDDILFSKAKDLSDEDKKAVLGIINALKKDVDKELDK